MPSVVRLIHLRQLSEHGGEAGVRDEGLLDSALARPRQRFAYEPYSTAGALGAAYASGIARNHPFVDGNKRTAMVVCLLFLRLNGHTIEADAADKYRVFYGLASGEVSEAELGAWLEARWDPVGEGTSTT